MTERDVIQRERAAFAEGVHWTHAYAHQAWMFKTDNAAYRRDERLALPLLQLEAVGVEAARRYPLPKVTRPRVVKDTDGTRWRISEGRLQFMRGGGDWLCMLGESRSGSDRYGMGLVPTPERIRLWADLLANPNEEVEQD